jgi:hypothetical protein
MVGMDTGQSQHGCVGKEFARDLRIAGLPHPELGLMRAGTRPVMTTLQLQEEANR